jgi:hypothetical protein
LGVSIIRELSFRVIYRGCTDSLSKKVALADWESLMGSAAVAFVVNFAGTSLEKCWGWWAKRKAIYLQAKMKSRAEHPVVDALYPLMLALAKVQLEMHSDDIHQPQQVGPRSIALIRM